MRAPFHNWCCVILLRYLNLSSFADIWNYFEHKSYCETVEYLVEYLVATCHGVIIRAALTMCGDFCNYHIITGLIYYQKLLKRVASVLVV